MKELQMELQKRLNGAIKIAFVGIGEEKMSDDGVGPYIISELLDFSSNTLLFINAGTDPMARVEDLVNFEPSHLVFIDTCTYPGEPGTVALLERKDLQEYVSISSHTIPVHIVIDLITERLPSITTFMIGIVPESLGGFTTLDFYKANELSIDDRTANIDLPFWEIQLTETIKRVADQLIEIIKELISNS